MCSDRCQTPPCYPQGRVVASPAAVPGPHCVALSCPPPCPSSLPSSYPPSTSASAMGSGVRPSPVRTPGPRPRVHNRALSGIKTIDDAN
ncbi:hypothetical protein BD309DRAFT_457957 [Dichomitus squalens]|uniref:Uncharacterized protein n=1 Tax=Dichomitus squalens TaxID=114155 RepID=A0A4Q9P068_9APHY|nr:hypothetical protein BD309DRAFT_457957 [Dichomitus squalens]TBU57753.1 hypothetical protein BD310DRAFT_533206 [Dichomitus squalens]